MEGIVVRRGGPKLSHLFFANDSLIFCKASIVVCWKEISRLEGEDAFQSRQGSADKSSSQSHPYVYHELLQITRFSLRRIEEYEKKFLVGAEER